MHSLTPKDLKNTARQRLRAAESPKKLTLWYSGIVLGLNLLAVILQWVTGRMMESTGGLAGLGTRAILETAGTVFSLAVQIAAPLLTMGFLYCCVRLARQQPCGPKQLLMGPRRWAVILRHGLLVGGIFLAITYLVIQIASILFMFLPSSAHAIDLMYTMMENPAFPEGDFPMEQLEEMFAAFLPMYGIAAVLFLAALIPVSYRLRLSAYRIIEDTPVGAVKAVLGSIKLMKGNCMALFKLDLSFWWYYLLQAAINALLLGSRMLLPGMSQETYLLLCCGYTAAMLALEYFFLAYMQTSYAVFYQQILENANTSDLPKIEE